MGVYSKKRNDNSIAYYYRFQYNGHRYCEVGGTTKTEALRAERNVGLKSLAETPTLRKQGTSQ